MYHGSRKPLTPHHGLCVTECLHSAEDYAIGGEAEYITTVEIDWTGLTVREVSGYDRDANVAVGDSDRSLAALAADGVDVVIYSDESPRGRAHETVRIVSARALAAIRIVSVRCDE